MRLKHLFWVVIPVLAAFFSSARAHGQTNDKARAKAKFMEGVALFGEEDYPGALTAFETSYKLRPKASVLYNIGMCEKALYRYTESIDTFRRYLDDKEHTVKPDRRQEVEAAIADMLALVGRLKIVDAPPGATLTINGQDRGSSPFSKPVLLDPGRHTVRLTASGRQPLETEVTIASGAEVTLRGELEVAGATITIDCHESEGMVFVDGEMVGGCPYTGEVSPGHHQIGVKAPDKKTFIHSIDVLSGTTSVIPVEMRAEGSAPGVSPPPVQPAPPPRPISLRVAWPQLVRLVKDENIPKEKRIEEIDIFLKTYPVRGKIKRKAEGWRKALADDLEPESFHNPRYMATKIEAISLRGYGGSYGGGAMLGFATGRWPWFYLGARAAAGGGVPDKHDSTRWWATIGLQLGVPFRIGAANHHEIRVGTGLLYGFLFTHLQERTMWKDGDFRWSFGLVLAPEVYYVWHIAKHFSLHVGTDIYIGVLAPEDTPEIKDPKDDDETARAAPVINGFIGIGI